jgi:hypothetical protein
MVEWTEPMESNTKTPVKTSVSTTKSPTKVTDNSKKIKKGKTIESNFSGNLQNEMVALLATNSVLLEQIMNNTGNGKPITLNGKKVNSGLLVTQRRNYAVAR